MGLYDMIIEMLDMRAFSSLWYWLLLALIWSRVNGRGLGIPYDMVIRARRGSDTALADLEILARIHALRQQQLFHETGLALSAVFAAVLSALALLGFAYGLETAQALFFLMAPPVLIQVHRLYCARRILQDSGQGAALLRCLGGHRLVTQLTGLVTFLITAVWGIHVIMTTPIL